MRAHSLLAGFLMAAAGAFGATSIQTALDNTSLSFSMGGDAEWFSQSVDVHTGTTALRSGAIGHNQETWVETTVSGAGMLSFWWKASSESVSYDWLEVSVDGNVQDQIGGSDAGWKQKSVFSAGAESHVIRWRYRKDGSVSDGEDCGWLDKVEWTPAPEQIVVTYVTNGGKSLSPANMTPGDTYGDLATPERDGYAFAGWCLDSELTERVAVEDMIPFRRSITVYAKWVRPVSLLDGGGIAFSSESGSWRAEDNAVSSGGYSAVTDVDEYEGGDRSDDLVLALHGAGTLTYKWRAESSECELACRMYGNYGWHSDWIRYSPSSSSGTYEDGWKLESLLLTGNESEYGVRFNASNDGDEAARFEMRDFKWTPAPT